MKDKNKKDKKDKAKKKFERIAEIQDIDFSDEVKRLNRVSGQIEGICKMLGDQRKLDDVLMQFKAVHSALRAIENRIVSQHVGQVLDEVASLDKKKSREQRVSELQTLFKYAS